MKGTEILAIYAAFLSTIVFVWNILRTIPRFKVDILFGVDSDEEEARHGVFIFARNPSPHTVHLAAIDILFPYGKRNLMDLVIHIFQYRRFPRAVGWIHSSLSLYGIDDGCPVALKAGKSHKVFISNEVLEEIMKDSEKRELRACIQDQLWRNKYSKIIEYPIVKKSGVNNAT